MQEMKNIIKGILGEEKSEQMEVDDFMQWQCDSFNDMEGNLNEQDGIECELCKNKGSIHFLKKGFGDRMYITERECYCMAKRKVFRRAKNSGLGEYLNKGLSDYIATEDWQKICKNRVADFMEKHSQDNTWMMACGTSGSGKTLLCSIIANHLLRSGRLVMYVTWTDFISKLKRDMMGDKTNKVSEYLEEVKKVEVLFLDEVVKKYNETDLKYLIEIVNYRYTNNLKTIITSERIVDELLDIDEATFGRAIEKSEGYIINIPKDRKKNYRLRMLQM